LLTYQEKNLAHSQSWYRKWVLFAAQNVKLRGTGGCVLLAPVLGAGQSPGNVFFRWGAVFGLTAELIIAEEPLQALLEPIILALQVQLALLGALLPEGQLRNLLLKRLLVRAIQSPLGLLSRMYLSCMSHFKLGCHGLSGRGK
jgi:hypothetical protein